MTTDAGQIDEEEPGPEPLRSREVFLDTEIYRRLDFNFEHPSLQSFKEHIRDDRLSLHLTDITKSEIAFQLSEQANTAVDTVHRARSMLRKWQSRAPATLGKSAISKPLDGAKIADESVRNFISGLRPFTQHEASNADARIIFEAYFNRRPPFDSQSGKSVKEFPDAFVIQALDAWCNDNSCRMYVVTADSAMRRAAAETTTLIPLRAIDHLLQSATLEHSPDVLEAVQALLDDAGLEERLGEAIDANSDQIEPVYVGDQVDGELTDIQRVSDPEISDWSVISASGRSFGLIIDVVVDLTAQLEFTDLSMATYDREDGVYFGAVTAHTEVREDGADLRMFVEIATDGSIVRSEILTSEVEIWGREYWD